MIAVYDSGLGGLLSLNKIVKDYPKEKIIYFGDSENAPYGNKNKEQINSMINKNLDMLKKIGAHDIILACNTICSCVDFCRKDDIKLHDIISKTVEQIDLNKESKILVFATKFAIKEGRYKEELQKRGYYNGEFHYLSKLAYYIEKYESFDNIKDYLFNEFSKISFVPDAIILGCTHFPIVEDIFREYYNVPIYNSRNLHFDINEVNDGPSLLIKMKKTEELERFLGTYLNVPYTFYE